MALALLQEAGRGNAVPGQKVPTRAWQDGARGAGHLQRTACVGHHHSSVLHTCSPRHVVAWEVHSGTTEGVHAPHFPSPQEKHSSRVCTSCYGSHMFQLLIWLRTQNCENSESFQIICCKTAHLKALWIWLWASQGFTSLPPLTPKLQQRRKLTWQEQNQSGKVLSGSSRNRQPRSCSKGHAKKQEELRWSRWNMLTICSLCLA